MSGEYVILRLSKVRFFSAGDEDAFFHWLRSIKCISQYKGVGVDILLEVGAESVDESSLRELIAFFNRYGVPMAQLAVFDRPGFSAWLHNPRAYWYSSMFGDESRSG